MLFGALKVIGIEVVLLFNLLIAIHDLGYFLHSIPLAWTEG